MKLCLTASSALTLCGLLAACNIPTAGSQATGKGQGDCIAAAARYTKLPADQFKVDSSQVGLSADVYVTMLSNTATGRRYKCNVDQNGIVSGVIELR